ncbi:hypothetical protein CSAL01_07187, partial [Colletotrichum salicis]
VAGTPPVLCRCSPGAPSAHLTAHTTQASISPSEMDDITTATTGSFFPGNIQPHPKPWSPRTPLPDYPTELASQREANFTLEDLPVAPGLRDLYYRFSGSKTRIYVSRFGGDARITDPLQKLFRNALLHGESVFRNKLCYQFLNRRFRRPVGQGGRPQSRGYRTSYSAL